jgi:hypothetical protein
MLFDAIRSPFGQYVIILRSAPNLFIDDTIDHI